jgi:hypothetical protein
MSAVLLLSIVVACVKLLRELPAIEDCRTIGLLLAFAVSLLVVSAAATGACCLALLDLRLCVEVVVLGSTCVISSKHHKATDIRKQQCQHAAYN